MDAPTLNSIWYWVSSMVLSAALFVPVSRLLWVWRVRALQRRLGRQASDSERGTEKRMARLLGGIIAISFAFLFNKVLTGPG